MLESISRNVNPLEIAVCLFVYRSLVLGRLNNQHFSHETGIHQGPQIPEAPGW